MDASSIVLLALSDCCDVYPLEEIHENLRLDELGIDSLRFMELIILLEERAQIEFPDEFLELSMEKTVRFLIQIIKDEMRNLNK
ncbi:phosphopantetheine binding protein [Paenibacillus cellulosilyticus]|uniref:Phosphopantetheine binding protein n=1 Tax=Paenibacillus cellulosilyticus TaxID=375489 RepID=A0A2V2YVE8_9BACL|nr:phosphopantetheine binding protein [Paenibacillus cellulosilyticus]QKS43675.1 acyl carrier protein [Paenibacillus cellulosilyticus]